MSFQPTTLKTRDLVAVSREDGRWAVKGRGVKPALVTHDELQSLLAKQRAKRARKQSRQ